MGTTPKYAIPYVEPTDTLAAFPTADHAQATAVEAALGTVKGALFRRPTAALTSDSNGMLTVPHGLGSGYTAVSVWVAGPQVGATGNVVAAFMSYLSVDATNVKFRIFRPDGTPFVGSVGVWCLGI